MPLPSGGTSISDLIIPSVFAPYFAERSLEKSAVLTSGIANNDPQMASFASGPGQVFNLPFFQSITGDDEVLQEGVLLNVNNITTEQEVAVVLNRAKAWGASYLSRVTSGEDIMGRIGNMVGDFWARKHQGILMSVLKAMFTDTVNAGGNRGVIRGTHLVDESGNAFDPNMIIDAMSKLGDNSDQLSAIVMHSAIYHSLSKNDLIDYQRDSEASTQHPTYLGKRVIIDDACTSETNPAVFRTYVFAAGAIQFGMGSIPPADAVETDRNTLGSEDIMITRQRLMFHPRGFKWQGSVNPSNSHSTIPAQSLSEQDNWVKVVQDKQIGMVALECLAI
jgi:hypothetical protein